MAVSLDKAMGTEGCLQMSQTGRNAEPLLTPDFSCHWSPKTMEWLVSSIAALHEEV